MYTNEQLEGLIEIERAKNDQLEHDVSVLIIIGRMYLDAIKDDPENEHLSLPDLLGLRMIEDVVNRYTDIDSISPKPEDPRVKVSEEIAYEIERELICCTEYDDFKGKGTHAIRHQICWWGSYAREIAIKVGGKYADAK